MSDGEGNRSYGETPVRDVLLSASDEVRMLSGMAGELQSLIGNLVVAGAFGGSQSIYELQNLDRLCQNLDAVGEFLEALSQSAAPNWKVDVARATQSIKLTDVATRLAGRKSNLQEQIGEFEEFDSWPLTG